MRAVARRRAQSICWLLPVVLWLWSTNSLHAQQDAPLPSVRLPDAALRRPLSAGQRDRAGDGAGRHRRHQTGRTAGRAHSGDRAIAGRDREARRRPRPLENRARPAGTDRFRPHPPNAWRLSTAPPAASTSTGSASGSGFSAGSTTCWTEFFSGGRWARAVRCSG